MIPRACRRVQRHLALHAGNDLGPRRARLVREHVGQCLPCAREVEKWRAGRAAMGALAGGHAEVESIWPGLERGLDDPGVRTGAGIVRGAVVGLPLAAAAALALWWGSGADEIDLERPTGYLRPVASVTNEIQPHVIHQPVLVPILWRTEGRGLRPVPSTEEITSLAGANRRTDPGK